MTGKGDAYEHDAKITGFGGGSGKAPYTGNADTANDPAGSRNEIDVKARNSEENKHGASTHQDTRTVQANPKMRDHETTAREADPDID